MPNLTLEYPLLIIDTSSRQTWVGLKLASDKLIHRSEEQDPSKTLFRLVEELTEEAGCSLRNLASIAFCAGPGSMLGARTASMAIRAWNGIGIRAASNVYSYNSLHLGALIASASPNAPDSGLVVTDARRSSWNALPFPLNPDKETVLLSNENLEAHNGPLVTFSDFPRWTSTKSTFAELTYDPTPLFENEAFVPILERTSEATPITVRTNEFKKWDAQIHSAPQQ